LTAILGNFNDEMAEMNNLNDIIENEFKIKLRDTQKETVRLARDQSKTLKAKVEEATAN